MKARKLERVRVRATEQLATATDAVLRDAAAQTTRAQTVLGETMAHASKLLASGAITTEEFALLVQQSEDNFGKQKYAIVETTQVRTCAMDSHGRFIHFVRIRLTIVFTTCLLPLTYSGGD